MSTDYSQPSTFAAVAASAPLGREALIETLVAAVGERGAALLGPPGSGSSTVLREVATLLVAGGRRVRLVRLPDRRLRPWEDDGDVVIVDDAHEATHDQTDALRDLAMQRPVVLGARSGAASSDLAWLWRSGTIGRVELADLADVDVHRIVERRAGGTVQRSTLDAIAHRAAGRPGFAVDEIDSLVADGRLEVRGFARRGRSTGEVGTRSIERATELLAALPADLAEMLATLAMAGPLPRHALATLAIDAPALTARALAVETDAALRLHPPGLAVGIRAALAPARAFELATRILASTSAALTTEDRVRLLVLTGATVELQDLAVAARAARRDDDRAATLALARLAAARGPSGVLVEAGLLADLGARAEAAERYGLLMADEAVAPDQRAWSAMERSVILLWDLGRPAEAVDTAAGLAAALAATPLAAAGTVHLASLTMYAGRPTEAMRLAAAVDETSAGAGVRAARTLVTTVAQALVDPGAADPAPAAALVDQDVDGAAERGVLVAATALALELQGRYGEAEAAVRAARASGPASDTTSSVAWAALAEARVELAIGRVRRARRAALDAAAGFADVNHPSGLRWAVGAAMLAGALAGDREATREATDAFDELGAGAPFLDADLLRARAWAAHALGNSARAAELLRDAAATATTIGAPTMEAVALHDAFRLLRAPVRTRLTQLARRWPVPAITLRARHAELVAAADPLALLELVADLEDAGALLLAAEAAADAARLATRRDQRSLARTAVGHRARLSALCDEPRTPGLADHRPVHLTAREQDVVLLAVEGRTSREIADELAVSVRTVENQLQRVFVKLGVHRRSELATRLRAEGYSAGGSAPR